MEFRFKNGDERESETPPAAAPPPCFLPQPHPTALYADKAMQGKILFYFIRFFIFFNAFVFYLDMLGLIALLEVIDVFFMHFF